MIAIKGDWVRIHNTVLEPDKRASHLPDDTKKCPLEMWVKGYLVDEEACIDDRVTVRTYIGREIEGTLIEVNPSYQHTFGDYIQELSYIGNQLRTILGGEDSE
ncbi:2-amino-4-oxopentanoate thiolase subunit OrtA [Vallitalea sp.]|jgi:hypothetical protein|uniref:2-amino-4-oxopentanoate thiolase subunit OrtA n=1 Tax=Vallitalea sp. TaxID=1882829 RepID=UPI0025E670DD|nr:2-amino-4-oxopentanoate thiolase subunit OrtA [Vallitalea sp.]